MRTEKITIDGTLFTVHELTMRDVLPLMEGTPPDKLSLELAKVAVKVGDKPLGDGVLDLTFSAYKKIIEAVNRVHKFDESDDEAKPGQKKA